MLPKRRPPHVTQLTGERASKAKVLSMYIKKTKKYCDVPMSDAGSGSSTGSLMENVGRGLRSEESKELIMLNVEHCYDCNGRNIEAFQYEYIALEKRRPLECQHKFHIGTITPLGPVVDGDLAPPITIPALDGLKQKAVRSGGSSISSVNLKNLQECKAALKKTYEELCQIQSLLEIAVGEMHGEISGHEDTYSEEAME